MDFYGKLRIQKENCGRLRLLAPIFHYTEVFYDLPATRYDYTLRFRPMAWNGVIVCDHYFPSEDFRHYCLGKLTSADSVAEVGRELTDHGWFVSSCQKKEKRIQ